ncbi:uncharacterized protein K02A2.6-like [Macrosteles quadrilineatus]|uniref:uncharacterized protein K02A2.6-like n=1 Tax=Macrosteles quadrilineatus TaxID=74068 RepID=UPI0023E20D53|nr:uncharacterized protein K02A2.6-like [Macrosteles quadrilineatus]
MSQSERRYAQVDREALSIIGGVKKFHNYLYGRHFEIRTDHKPLLGLFTVDKQTPNTLSPRMIRWSILLNGYDFDLVYKPGISIPNADGLSRLPCSSNVVDQEINEVLNDVLYIESDEVKPITANIIAKETEKDPLLSKVLLWTQRGCLLWGTRVIIPSTLRQQALKLLHMGHEGIVRTKALARSYFWWPKLDQDIENIVNSCQACQQSRHNPPRATVLPWEKTKQPWSRLHIDFAGPFQNKLFLIVVDSFSKWLEVVLVPSTDSRSTIKVLRSLFATHGVPDTIVSDNGSAFTSQEFRSFNESNGIRHVVVAPYHSSSNGQAERMVQTTKNSLRRILQGDWQKRLAQFLISSHITPNCSTNMSPSELLFGRRIRTILDRVHPDYSSSDKEEKILDKALHDYQQSPQRKFKENDSVFARNYNQRGPKWIPAKVTRITGPLSYHLITKEGIEIRRHIDQLRPRSETSKASTNSHLDNPESPVNPPFHPLLQNPIQMRTPEAHHITPVQPPSMVSNPIMMRTPDVQPMRPSVMQQSRNSFSGIEGSINPHQEDAGFNVSGLIQDSTSMSTSPQPVRSRVSRSNSQNTSMSMSPRPVRIRRPPAYLKDYLTGGGVLCIKK